MNGLRRYIQDKLTAAQLAAINAAVGSNTIVQVSSTYTALSTDGVIECTSGTFTVALPTAVGIAAKRYEITNSGTGVITVNPFGSETINGQLTIELLEGDSLTIVSNDSNWLIL